MNSDAKKLALIYESMSTDEQVDAYEGKAVQITWPPQKGPYGMWRKKIYITFENVDDALIKLRSWYGDKKTQDRIEQEAVTIEDALAILKNAMGNDFDFDLIPADKVNPKYVYEPKVPRNILGRVTIFKNGKRVKVVAYNKTDGSYKTADGDIYPSTKHGIHTQRAIANHVRVEWGVDHGGVPVVDKW